MNPYFNPKWVTIWRIRTCACWRVFRLFLSVKSQKQIYRRISQSCVCAFCFFTSTEVWESVFNFRWHSASKLCVRISFILVSFVRTSNAWTAAVLNMPSRGRSACFFVEIYWLQKDPSELLWPCLWTQRDQLRKRRHSLFCLHSEMAFLSHNAETIW